MQLSYDENLIHKASDIANELITKISGYNDVKFNFAISLAKLEDGLKLVEVSDENSDITEFDMLIDIGYPVFSNYKESFENDNAYIVSILCSIIKSILSTLCENKLNEIFHETSIDDYIYEEMEKKLDADF